MKTIAGPLTLLAGSLALSVAFARGGFRNASLNAVGYRTTQVVGDTFPKRLVRDSETRVLERRPERIASLTTTSDDILTSLVDPSRIVGITPFTDDPVISLSAGRVPKSAARIRGANPEGLIALEPDIVFAAHYTLDSGTRLLDAAHIPIVRLRQTTTAEDVFSNLRTIASAVGEEERAARVETETRVALRKIEDAVRGRTAPRVLYYSGAGYTAGSKTLVDEKIRLSGGRNVVAEAALSGFPHVALDLLIALDPDVILLPHWTPDGATPVRELTEAAAWRDVKAVRERRVYALPAAVLTSESPDGLVASERVARLIHPEAFP